MYDCIYTVGCDGIKITMATKQVRKPVKHQRLTDACMELSQPGGTFYDRIYTVGCDSIKITMATQQLRDALAMTLKQNSWTLVEVRT